MTNPNYPTIIGTGASSNSYATNEKPVDMTPEMAQNYMGLTPATAILTRVSNARRAQNVQFDWIIEEVMPHKVTFDHASESGSGNTTIYCNDYKLLGYHDQLYVPRTGEVMHVGAAVSSSSITVRRGVGDTSETNLEAGDTIFILANAQEEGLSAIDTSRMAVNSRDYNYTQIITEMVNTTNSADNESTYFGGAGSKRERNQFKMNYNLRIKTELAIMLNYRENYTSGTLPQRSMGGFLQWLATGPNVLDLSGGSGGVLTESALDSFLADIKNTHPDMLSLACFASYQFISKISSMFKDKIRISPNTTTFGLNIDRYFGAMGLDLIPAPLLDGDYLGGTAFMVDLTHVDLKYLRPFILKKNVNNSDDDDFARDRIRGEVGMRFAIPSRHGMITGLAI